MPEPDKAESFEKSLLALSEVYIFLENNFLVFICIESHWNDSLPIFSKHDDYIDLFDLVVNLKTAACHC